MNTLTRTASLLATAVLLAACGGERSDPQTAAPAVEPEPATAEVAPVDAFLARIAQHCGQAFAGRIAANEPQAESDPFADKPLVMHVRECGATEIKIPFHVGDDHSRTWVLTRTDSGLRLKHDHRHEDGSEDTVTMYGGDTAEPGTDSRQEFPVDAYSIEMFEREGMNVSTTNTWAMEIRPNEQFVYELYRPGRIFRVEFDLTAPVDAPPTPWGHPEIE